MHSLVAARAHLCRVQLYQRELPEPPTTNTRASFQKDGSSLVVVRAISVLTLRIVDCVWHAVARVLTAYNHTVDVQVHAAHLHQCRWL